MMSRFLANYSFAALNVFGMFLFMGVFLGVGVWVFNRKNWAHFEKLAQLPLEKENTSYE